MNTLLQKQFFRQIRKDFYEDQTYASKIAGGVYGVLAVFLNSNVARHFLQTRSWTALHEPVLINLFLVGCLLLLLSLPSFIRYVVSGNWFICKREMITHFASRAHIPPSHLLLSRALLAIVIALAVAFGQILRQTTANRPPHLNLRRNAPFLLFQRANLLLAP